MPLHDLTRGVGIRLSNRLTSESVVMSTALLATIMLMHRKGIEMDNLLNRVRWLYDQLKYRNCTLGTFIEPNHKTIMYSLKLIKDLIDVKPRIVEITKTNKRKFHTAMY